MNYVWSTPCFDVLLSAVYNSRRKQHIFGFPFGNPNDVVASSMSVIRYIMSFSYDKLMDKPPQGALIGGFADAIGV